MARRKPVDRKIAVGNITDVSGEVTIAGGDLYKGFTAEQVSILLTQITSTFQPKPFDGRCPYKGLDVFEEEDVELFFGREKLVDDLVGRVKESRTVFITGPSGSGKSSLVRAGLIPALKQGKIENSDRWLYETINPGRDPFEALALAFSRLKSPELEKYFQEHNTETDILNQCAESALSGRKDQHFVLFIDQFEEVFTQVAKERVEAFINLLTYAATLENGRVIVLFAMRSDFVSNCAAYPALNELLSQQFRQIGAMQPEELVSAIALPARHVGLPIEDELVARIINDMKGEPGALPLMQFALKDLFDSQQEKGGVFALTLEDYLRDGGIHKSLERHADNSFAKLSEAEQQFARSIFSGLIEIGRGTQDTRRTALFDELIPSNTKAEEVKAIVQKLADARLITTDETDERTTITLAHEKLIDAWPWLKKLVDENRDVIALQNEIAHDAKEWEDKKRNPSYLYSGTRLANAHEQILAKGLALTGLAQEYVLAGRARQQRSRLAFIMGISAILISLVLGVIVFSRQSITNAQLAKLNGEVASTAQSANTLAVAQKATAQANAEEAQKQAQIALARQLFSQAQTINTTQNSKGIIAVLLCIQSMRLFPTGDASNFLINNNHFAIPVSLMTHDKQVTSVAFSPDGNYVVSASYDFTVRVWEAASGKEIARMLHDYLVTSVAFSPDGKYVISGSDDRTARVWEAFTGKEIASMIYDHRVSSLAFSPDSRYVVSGGDFSVLVWEAFTGKEVARMTHDDPVWSVTFSPDGKFVVSGSSDGTARVWEVASGKEIARMTHDNWVSSIAFSPDGKYVVSGSYDFTVHVWEAFTGKEIARMIHDSWVLPVAFSSDGKYIISGGDDNTARVWEATTGKEIARMTHDDAVTNVAFSPDGMYVVSGSSDGTARVWAASTGREVTRMTHDRAVWSVDFSPDGKYVVSGSVDGTARVWKADGGNAIPRITHDSAVDSVAFSPDGKLVVSGSDDNTARVWEIASGKEIARMTHDYWVSSVAFSPDSKFVVSGSLDHTVRVWEAATGKEVTRMTHESKVYSVAFSPDGKYIVLGGDFTALVWEVSTGKNVAPMLHDSEATSVAFSPDGNYVVSGSADGTARVWDTSTWEEVARMTHDDWVTSVAFSPDGNLVVSGSTDATVRVWEATTDIEIFRMHHDGSVFSVAFSPDGEYIVSASEDITARVWEVASGNEVARITHGSEVHSVSLSPDGKYVASGSGDNTIRIWTWRSTDLITKACEHLPRNLTRSEWIQYIGDALPYQAVCANLPIDPE